MFWKERKNVSIKTVLFEYSIKIKYFYSALEKTYYLNLSSVLALEYIVYLVPFRTGVWQAMSLWKKEENILNLEL